MIYSVLTGFVFGKRRCDRQKTRMRDDLTAERTVVCHCAASCRRRDDRLDLIKVRVTVGHV